LRRPSSGPSIRAAEQAKGLQKRGNRTKRRRLA
jgi:hypothetical protein